MTQRSAEIAYQVLESFQWNGSYEDYRDGEDTPFTDVEYWQMLQELYPLAHASVPDQGNPSHGEQTTGAAGETQGSDL